MGYTGPFNPFIRNGELEDEKIMMALRRAADEYDNGEIAEVHDLLFDVVEAIQKFMELYEEVYV